MNPETSKETEATETNEPMMTIGLFARSCLLSVKALRHYHQQGILIPAAVDPQSGYRAYHPGQLADATAIRKLRALDVPVPTIKEILANRDPEVTTKLLADHEEAMRQRLAETEQIVANLQQAIDGETPSAAVHVRTVEHQDAIAISGLVERERYSAFLDQAYPRLGAALGPELTPVGPFLALYDAEVTEADAQRVVACAPIRIGGAVELPDGIELAEVPAATVAVAVHHGSYDDIGDTYAALVSWVAYHATPTGQAVREIYAVSYNETADPAEFRTEIHWPIQP